MSWVLVFFCALYIGRHWSAQVAVALALMLASSLVIFSMRRVPILGRERWVAVNVGIVFAGIVAIFLAPQWSGYIVAAGFAVFTVTPSLLGRLALRLAEAGYSKAAAVCARVIGLLHLSRRLRFQWFVASARLLPRIADQVAMYREWDAHPTAEETAALNCWISFAWGDWENLLEQARSAPEASDLQWCAIRALGELGRIDEVIATYASAESVMSPESLLAARVTVLAFSGRTDTVLSLLSRKPQFFDPRTNAYWIFVAQAASGSRDEGAWRSLAGYAYAADEDEAFRKRAQHHLDAGPGQAKAVLSFESLAIVAAIEKSLELRRQH